MRPPRRLLGARAIGSDRPLVELLREAPEGDFGYFDDYRALGTVQPESNGTPARKNGKGRGVYAKAPCFGAARADAIRACILE